MLPLAMKSIVSDRGPLVRLVLLLGIRKLQVLAIDVLFLVVKCALALISCMAGPVK